MGEFLIFLQILLVIAAIISAFALVKISGRLGTLGEKFDKCSRREQEVRHLRRQIDDLKRELEEMKQKE